MSLQGVVLIDLLGFGFILWLLNLVRTKKLNISYASIWFLAVMGMVVIISVPDLLNSLPLLVGATYPASALSLLAFIFIFIMLIFISVQLSILGTRQTELIQDLAIKGLLKSEQGRESPAAENNETAPV